MRAMPRRRIVAACVAVIAAATLANLVVTTYPNYDMYANIVWGDAIANGVKPDLREPFAPTPHPLEIAAGVAVSPFEDGDRIMVILVLAAFVALLVGVYALTSALFGIGPAIAATAIVALNPSLLRMAVTASADVPFLACVVGAFALELRYGGGRPRLVLALLLLGGLLRPEAWVLSVMYLAYDAWREHRIDVVNVVLSFAAPVIWVLTDLALTGDPVHSLTWTSGLADSLGRSRSAFEGPPRFVGALAHLMQLPVMVLAVIGVVLAVRARERLRLAPAAVLFVVGAGAYLGIVAGGFSAIDRYAWMAVIALTLFAGYALGGFTGEQDPRVRERWRRLSVTSVVVGIAGFAALTPNLNLVQQDLVDRPRLLEKYDALLHRPAVRAASRCGPVNVDAYFRIYETRWALDAPTARVQPRPARSDEGGVLFSTLTDTAVASEQQRDAFPRFVESRRSGREQVDELTAYLSCPPSAVDGEPRRR